MMNHAVLSERFYTYSYSYKASNNDHGCIYMATTVSSTAIGVKVIATYMLGVVICQHARSTGNPSYSYICFMCYGKSSIKLILLLLLV